MKLPKNQFQALKLQKIRPLKRSLVRLSRGKLFNASRSQTVTKDAQSSNRPPNQPSAASSTAGNSLATSIEATKSSKGFRLALNLLLVRPWILVAGFWLFSMAGGTLALNGMLSPRKLKMALPEPAVVESPVVSSSNISVTPDSDELPSETPGETGTEADTPEVISIGGGESSAESGEGGSNFPLLPLTILVGGCATGCLIVSRRRAMARMAAARARSRARIRKSAPVRAGQSVSQLGNSSVGQSVQKSAPSKANASRGRVRKTARPAAPVSSTASATPKLKKRRQRVRKTSATKPATASNRVLASRATAQPAAAKAPSQSRASKRQIRRASMRAASRRQPMVSVVPANESHSLDWNNGSLAHQMDVRPHRSAM